MAHEERKNVELWAEATKKLATPDLNPNLDITFLVDNIINKNTSIPIIITDTLNHILVYKNISFANDNRDIGLKRELEQMKEENDPIIISLS